MIISVRCFERYLISSLILIGARKRTDGRKKHEKKSTEKRYVHVCVLDGTRARGRYACTRRDTAGFTGCERALSSALPELASEFMMIGSNRFPSPPRTSGGV